MGSGEEEGFEKSCVSLHSLRFCERLSKAAKSCCADGWLFLYSMSTFERRAEWVYVPQLVEGFACKVLSLIEIILLAHR